MRIGDTVDPRLGAVDYSQWIQAHGEAVNRTAAALSSGLEAIGSAVAERRQMESKTKANSKLIEEALKLFPDSGYLTGVQAALNDEKTPLPDKIALGNQIGTMLELGIAKTERDRDYNLKDRSVKVDEQRVKYAADQANAENSTAQAKIAQAHQLALSDAISTLQPVDDILTQLGENPPSPARKRVESLIREGRGPEALTAAREWVESVRPQISKQTQAKNGVRFGIMNATMPDGSAAEQNVWIDDANGKVWDMMGNQLNVPPPSLNQAPSAGMAPPGTGNYVPQSSNQQRPANSIANAIQQDGTGPGFSPPAPDPETLAGYIGGDRSQVPFGKLPPNQGAYGSDGSVLPPRNDVDFSAYIPAAPGNRIPPMPVQRLGVRPLVSPKETPAEALAKSRQTKGDDRLTAQLEQASTLADGLDRLKQTKALLEEVRTGFGADTIVKAKRMLGADVSSAEQLQTLLGDQVMARIQQTKGAVSEREMDLFTQYSANFGKTADGNRKIIEFAEKAAERAKKIQSTIQEGFASGKTPYAIEQEVSRIKETNPITDTLKPPAAAPNGIPLEEDDENRFFKTKPR